MRYSITNPDAYIESNIIGFYNILEACRHSYDNGEKWSRAFSFMHHRLLYMERINKFHTLQIIK